MAAAERWYFSEEQIKNSPSFKFGYDIDKELSCRQQAANFIQDMGQRLQVTQLCINTAIVYMHRFYMFHSFTRFHRASLASAALFLAAKVEEQPRKLEHIIRVANVCLHREQSIDIKSEAYNEQAQDLIMNENILLQTLGFDVAIDHPHTHIVKFCQLVRASKDLAQTSYFMASYSLHLTTMCLQYKPTVVACFCIHLACKWSNWEIPDSVEGRPWFWYVDSSVTSELLEKLTNDFLSLFEKCPSRLKKKIASLSYQHMPQSSQGPEPGRSYAPEIERRRDAARAAVESHAPSQQQLPTPSASSVFPTPHLPLVLQPSYPREDRKPPKPMPVESSGKKHRSHYPNLPPPPHHGRSESTPRAPVAPSSSNSSSSSKPMVPSAAPPSISTSSSSSTTCSTAPSNSASNTGTSNIMAPNGLAGLQAQKVPPPPPPPPPQNRPPSTAPRARNGDHHVPKKPEVEVKPWVVKPEPWPVRPLAPLPPRSRTPPQITKPERSIFSPEEKASPPPPVIVKAVSPPPPAASPPPPPATTAPPAPPPAVIAPAAVPPAPTVVSSPPKPNGDVPPADSASVVSDPKAAKKKKKKHKDHKDKHKDKHKHKHKAKDPEPIKITIPKDKISLSQPSDILKIKIAKEKITPTSPGLKIKISKDKLKDSKKRERSEERDNDDRQPSKHHRPNGTTVQVGAESAESGHH